MVNCCLMSVALIKLSVSLIPPVALPRSKSTPGLLESSGKVPLENMMIIRSSLPSTIMKRQGGAARDDHDRKSHNGGSGGMGGVGGEPSYRRTPCSSHGSRHGSVTAGSSTGNMAAGDTQDTGCGITNSMTISSITSYVTDGSGGAGGGGAAHRSPTAGDAGRTDASPASRTQSAGSSRTGGLATSPSASTTTVGMDAFQRPASPALFGASRSSALMGPHAPRHTAYTMPATSDAPSHHALPVFTTLPQTHPTPPLVQPTPHMLSYGGPTVSPPYLSAGSAGGVKSHSPLSGGGSPHSFTSYNTYPPGTVPPPAPPSSLVASSSVGSLSGPQNEVLLQEITRLRERLQSLESENATMSVKLNQQQWEVENRLAEIEMHICGSDHSCSGSEVGNKESVI